MIASLLLANKPASLFGVVALAASIAAGVQSLRLAHAEGDTAEARLALAEFRRQVAEAALEQQRRDDALAAALIARQADRLARLHDQTLVSLRRLADAPVTRDCGPVMRDASRSLRQLLHGDSSAGDAAARPQPAAPLR